MSKGTSFSTPIPYGIGEVKNSRTISSISVPYPQPQQNPTTSQQNTQPQQQNTPSNNNPQGGNQQNNNTQNSNTNNR